MYVGFKIASLKTMKSSNLAGSAVRFIINVFFKRKHRSVHYTLLTEIKHKKDFFLQS